MGVPMGALDPGPVPAGFPGRSRGCGRGCGCLDGSSPRRGPIQDRRTGALPCLRGSSPTDAPVNSVRRVVSVLAAAGVGFAVFAVCFLAASRFRQSAGTAASDELAWVCREFQLSDAEATQLRALHAGYRPECEAMCQRIDAKNRELEGLLARSGQVSPEIERVLRERAALRAECQARMLQHFQSVAATMPGERGARYLAEMHRLTLGLHAPGGSGSGAAVVHESH